MISHATSATTEQPTVCISQIRPVLTSSDSTVPEDVVATVLQALHNTLRADDQIHCLADGKFCLTLHNLKGANHAKLAAAKFHRLTQSLTDNRYAMHTGLASAQVLATYDPESLQQWADIACREAIQADHYGVVADTTLIDRYSQRLQLGDDLNQAMLQHDLVLFYQPQLDQEGCVSGFEGLVRWQKDQLLSPNSFVPDLKPAELYALSRYTARQLIRDLAAMQWLPALSLNLDPAVLDDALLQFILDELALWQVEPHRLTIEITEAGLVHNYDNTVALLAKARQHGILVAIDDFGTGYSSLQHFKQLPIDELKIDMVFVRNLMTDEHNQYLCRMMIDLAHRFDHHVVAEGVEDQWTADWLFANGCDLLQGYYFSPPLPKDCLAPLLNLQTDA